MAKKAAKAAAAAKAPEGNGDKPLMEATFRHFKETKNTNRFNEETSPGEQGLIGALYLRMPVLEKASVITARLYDAEGETNLEGTVEGGSGVTVAFEFEKETKNAVRFKELGVAPGERAVVGTLYVKKSVFTDGDVPQNVLLSIEG